MSHINPVQGVRNSHVWFFTILVGLIVLGLIKDYLSFLQSIDDEFAFLKFILEKGGYTDSWWPMYHAGLSFLDESEKGIYEAIFYTEGIKFQYPPISLLPFIVLIKLNISWLDIVEYTNLISFLSIFIIVLVVYKIAVKVLVGFCPKHIPLSLIEMLFLIFLIFIGTFTFYPIIWAQHLGQVQIFIDLLICLVFLTFLGKRKYLSGALIALAMLIKPQYGIILLWALVRKEKEYAIGMLAVLIPAGFLSLAIFGFQEHLDYIKVISFIGKHGEVFWANQSLNGLLNRLLSDVNSLTWDFHSFAPYNAFVRVVTVTSAICFILLGLLFRPRWVRQNDGPETKYENLLDLSTMFIVTTISSPIAWEHHYGIFLPIYIIVFSMVTTLFREQKNWQTLVILIFLCISYFFVSNYFYFAVQEQFAEKPINILQSYFYFGGLLLLGMILWLRVLIASSSPFTPKIKSKMPRLI